MKGYMFFHITEYQLHVSFCVQTCKIFLKSGNKKLTREHFQRYYLPVVTKTRNQKVTRSNNQVEPLIRTN